MRTEGSKSRLWFSIGLGLLFFAPLLSGVIGRLINGRKVYNGKEFETLLCAGAKAADGQSMYPPAHDFSCEQFGTMPSYVYIPWSAEASQNLVSLFGAPLVTSVYAVVFFASVLFAVWVSIFKPMAWADMRERLPFAGAFTGSIVLWGNVAGVVYGLIALAALVAARMPLVFVGAIIFAGSIKQVWLCLLAVVLLLPIRWWKRWTYFLLGAVFGLLPTVLFVATGSSEVEAWISILSFYAIEYLPGHGYLGWLRLVGIDDGSPLDWALWPIFAAVLITGGLGIAERFELEAEQRVWLGLAIGSLLIPRLLAYEFFLFAPGMIVVLNAARSEGMRWVSWMVYGGCGLMLLFNVGDLGDYAMIPLTLTCSIAIAVVGLPYAWTGLRAVLPVSGPIRSAA
jgi:hypothetical protein